MDGQEPGKDGLPGKYKQVEIGLSLFDMENDPHEIKNVLEEYPEIAARLKLLAEKHQREFFPAKSE
jgi:arylsulfatase